MPYRHPKTGQWYSDFMADDPKTGRRRRFRQPLGDEVRTLREAREAEAQMRVKVAGGGASTASVSGAGRTSVDRAIALPPAAFSGFAKHWMDVRVAKRKPSTRLAYTSICKRWLVPHFGDRELSSITQLHVEELQAKAIAVKASPKTVNNIIGCLSSMLEAAVEWGYLRTNPCEKVEPLTLPPYTFQFYTREQSDVFLATAQRIEPAWYPLFFTGFRTGMRLGEMFALTWDDVDFVRRVIHVRRSVAHKTNEITLPKGGRGREVAMSPALSELLRSIRHMRSDLVFCATDGRALTGDMLKRPWRRVTRASGLPKIRPHDMRHSFASQLVVNGAPLKAVQELLGHADIKMTMRYSHLAPGKTDEYVSTLDGHTSCHTSATPAVEPSGSGREKARSFRVIEWPRAAEAVGFEPTPAVPPERRSK